MRISIWASGMAGIGALLSLKDANWLGDPTPRKLGVLGTGLLIGGTLGICIGLIVKPARTKKERIYKVCLWIGAFALLGLILGHGNVPWSRTFEVIAFSCVIGAVIGVFHYYLSTRGKE